MEAFFVGLGALIIGGILVVAGYQLFPIVIPVWGFFAGFTWGAEALAVSNNTGFLATFLGWGVGLVAGLIMAIFAYLYYELAIGILAGFISYWIIGSLFLAFGFTPGFFVNSIATLAGIILGIVALYLRASRGLLIVLTAFGGATATIGGLLVMFWQQPIGVLGTSLIAAIIAYSLWWTVVWIALIAVGVIVQLRLSESLTMEVTNRSAYYSSMELTGAKGGKATSHKKDH